MTKNNYMMQQFRHSLVSMSDFKRQPTKYLKAIGREQSLNITVRGRVTYVVERQEDSLESSARYFAALKKAGDLGPELKAILERDGDKLYGAGWDKRG